MLPTIATGNVGSALAGEYEVANSLRFDDGSNDYLNKTFSTPTNNKIWTWSGWVKKCSNGITSQTLFGSGPDGNNQGEVKFLNDNLQVFDSTNSANNFTVKSNAIFRDVSAWYHVVASVDTTQSTSSDRVKIYINGSQITSLATSSYPSINLNTRINANINHTIGRRSWIAQYYDGYMAEVCFIDGQQLDPTSFGEFDENSGIWKPIDVSGLTFGNNGFYLDFENSGSLGADVSGNGNNFTVNNLTSIDQTTDTCTNNFATYNPLDKASSITLSEGNVKAVCGTDNRRAVNSTMAVSQGKWYAEFEFDAGTGANIGVISTSYHANIADTTRIYNYSGTGGAAIYNLGGTKRIDGVSTSYGDSYTTGDIIGVALNLDDDEITFYKNGTSQGTITTKTFTGDYYFTVGHGSGSNSSTILANFGNPSFSISSGNSDANGYGNFEYSVPSGYYALNTKNLAEYG